MAPTRDPLNAFLDYPEVPVTRALEGPLDGVRLAVKDIYDVAGYPTGCGNPEKLAENGVAPETAPAVQKLFDAGARFVGKTQTDELAFSLMGINAHYPQPVNKAAPGRVTGGSSSGSAAAVAGGLAEVAIGSDTGGSIRAPASFCGLIGLRTTHGRVSLEGAMPLAPSLDTFGYFADDIESYEAVGRIVLGRDEYKTPLARLLSLSILEDLVASGAEAEEYQRMKAIVEKALGSATPISPFTASIDELYWAFRRIQALEAWNIHGEWLSKKERNLGPGIEDRFGFGRTVDAKAEKTETMRRYLFRAELKDLLMPGALMVLPTVPGAAPLKNSTQDQFQAYRERALRLLCLSGLSGFPQITLPLGMVDGAPFGISLIGPPDSDIALIKLARRILSTTKTG
jgi:amidase